MKNRVFLKAIVCLMCAVSSVPAMAQFNLKKAISGAVKATQAVTLTDEQMGEYVKEYITWMDANNQVCADDNEYTIRLKKLTEGLGDADGIPLNFKVYSQKQECAADDYGYEFLKKAGKNPWAMALSFQKLKSLQEQSGGSSSSKLNQLFSTHPDLDLRIKRMEERANNEGIEKPVIK